jgi:ubiquinol-cytochrome c reductase cytochrome c subunit
MKKIWMVALLLPAFALAQDAPGNAEKGKLLFMKVGCYECHGTVGQGTLAGARLGPPRLNAAGVIRYVRRPAGQMPAFTNKVLSDQELTDVYAFLKSIPEPKAVKDIPLLDGLRTR